jgi:hypothetical protein
MTSREHARRLMLILLSGDAAPLRLDEDGTAAEESDDRADERTGRPGGDRAEASSPAAHRRKETLIAAYAWT